MPPFTPEQVEQLQTWASERDTVLNEIAQAKIERDILVAQNKALADSNSDLSTRLIQTTTRIEERELKEKDLANKVSSETADLLVLKSQLQTEISALKSEVATLFNEKQNLVKDIEIAKDTNMRISTNANLLNYVVDHVTKVSQSNRQEINQLMEDLKKEVQEVIDLNVSNVEKTNYVINELPHIFFALQRHVPIKKTAIL